MISPKEAAEIQRRIEPKIAAWVGQEEGWKLEKQPARDGIIFTYFVDVPIGAQKIRFQIVRPARRSATSVALLVDMADEHKARMQSMSATSRQKFILSLRRTAFAGGVIGFGPTFEGETLVRWIFDYTIYDDALTQHEFALTVKRLTSKHLEFVDTIQEGLGGGAIATGGGLSGYQ